MLSNLFLLFPFVLAIYYRLIGRAFVYFSAMIASSLYHLCDSYGACLFDFHTLHNFDFFFAQLLIWLGALYFVHWPTKYSWVEWILALLGALFIVVLLIVLPGELYVQAGIAGVGFLLVIIYWFIAGIPKYRWSYVVLALALSGSSIVLFSIQNIWPGAYWGVHSLWHVAAAIGQFYLLMIKPRKHKVSNAYQNLLSRIPPSRIPVAKIIN